METKELRISVRNFVEFLLRSGDIDNRGYHKPESAMQEGARIHRMIQGKMGSEYQAEVSLKYEEQTPKYKLIIEGRADGIITIKQQPEGKKKQELLPTGLGEEEIQQQITIDEIKGTYKKLEKIDTPEPVHLAQARVYAFIYAERMKLKEIRVRMTYCNLETEEIKYFFYEYTLKELKEWFKDLIEEYKKWADFQIEWKKERQESIKIIEFPFSYRLGQKDLAQAVYRTIYHKRKLFLQAPTGVGKTISTVFPAIKALGQELGEQLFYFTAKTITRTVAEEAFQLLRKQKLKFKTVTLTAKEKICFLDKVQCNPGECPYAKGHFDRINEALYQMITKEDFFSKERIKNYAERFKVCPFELSLDAALFSDGVIGDYNYLFDPHAALKRFFKEGVNCRGIFLIDEAHNLVERGREMYSAILKKEDFLSLKKKIRPYSVKVEKKLNACNRQLVVMKKETMGVKKWSSIEGLILSLNSLYQALCEYLENTNDSNVREEVLEFFFKIKDFLTIYDNINDGYVIYSELEEEGNFYVKLFCVNPASLLKSCMDKGDSSILFSATFLPIQYYKKLLGGEKEDYEIYAKSPFLSENRSLCIARDVTSKYKRRGKEEYQKIAGYINQAVKQKKGNYMIFFPSYSMMEQVGEIYINEFNQENEAECVFQKEMMKEEEREKFLKLFTGVPHLKIEEKINMKIEIEQESSLLGFCVLGGIFSEGIDLKADSLIGVIIVGTGLPQVCTEKEILKEYYNQHEEKGFDYAYRYPGMNKVLQAAGRVIRTREDRGIILLLDERFLEKAYLSLFPREWEEFHIVDKHTLGEVIKEFWNEKESLS